MSKIKYVDRSFRKDTLSLIETANVIIEDYQARGYELTLRQLYYQIIARDLFPEERRYSWDSQKGKWVKDIINGTKNAEPNYIWLGSIISKARDAGLVDWDAIVDRTRSRKGLATWNDAGHILREAHKSFRVDKWKDQDYKIFVWVEKEALAGVIQRACSDKDIQVDYISCKGYMSASTIWREARNLRWATEDNQTPIIIHLGDHDPSGIDMTRDNIERLELYSGLYHTDYPYSEDDYNEEFSLQRIALNYDQVEQYNPPPNPTKLKDTRAANYVDKYGYESWELDALDPDVLVTMIQDKINSYKNQERWDEMVALENKYLAKLKHVAENWESI